MLSEVSVGKDLVAFKLDVGDSEPGTLFDLECESDGSCRNLFDDGFDFCLRAPFVGKQLFNHCRGALGLDRVILRFL